MRNSGLMSKTDSLFLGQRRFNIEILQKLLPQAELKMIIYFYRQTTTYLQIGQQAPTAELRVIQSMIPIIYSQTGITAIMSAIQTRQKHPALE